MKEKNNEREALDFSFLHGKEESVILGHFRTVVWNYKSNRNIFKFRAHIN